MLIHCRRLLAWLTILSYLYTSSHQSFIATFPSSVVPGSWAKFCISFQNITSDISFTLQNHDQAPPCFNQVNKIVDSRINNCFDIWIDETCKDKSDTKISITGSSTNGDYSFSDSKYFVVRSSNFFRLIETDKPVYKPGDKLRIRVLTLDFQLKPLVKQFLELYVMDSSGSRVGQWSDIKDSTGLIEMDMPISLEPNLGNWKVQLVEIDGKIITANFEIKKYVLPKFEVTLSHPEKVWASSNKLTVNVCSKYSHGNDVRGDFVLKAYTKRFSYSSYKEEIHKTSTKSKKAKGCANFNIQLKELGIDQSSYIYSLFLDAQVTEEKTNIVMNKSSSVSVSFRNFEVNLIQPTYYKPGFKSNFQLSTKSVEGIPYSNEKIKVTIERESKIFYENIVTTDKDGNFEFTYDPETCSECSQLDDTDKPPSVYLKVGRVSDPLNTESFPISSWYTEKNSYISITKPLGNKNLQCDQSFSTEIIIKTIDSNSFSKKLYLQMQSRSKFSIIAEYDLERNLLSIPDGENSIDFKVEFKEKRTIPKAERKQNFYFNGKPTYQHDEYILTVSFNIIADMSPQFNLLAYFVFDNEIIPDTLTIDVPKCLENKVRLTLSQKTVRPSRAVNVTIESEPNSICALSAIDKSVSFMGKRNTVDTNKIFSALSQFELVDWQLNFYESSSICEKNPWEMSRFIPKRRSIYNPFGSQFFDPSRSFNQAKVVIMSDLKVYRSCRNFPFYAAPRSFFMNLKGPMPIALESNSLAFEVAASQIKTDVIPLVVTQEEEVMSSVRTFFPETWLWSLDIAGENGLINKREISPDSITDWLIDAYCMSTKTGLGIADTQTLKVFQTHFVSVNLPYSVIRGEIFPVFATIFNYHSSCTPILIEVSGDQGLAFINSKVQKICVCPDEEKTHKFELKAFDFSNEKGFNITVKARNLYNATGVCDPESQKISSQVRFVDYETRKLIVEPEGIPKEQVKSLLFVFKDQKSTSQDLEITLPPNIIQKSSRAYLRVTGDAIGSVLDNLESLVQQPTGCGEQNMVKFAPIVSVANYLNETNQLNSKLQKKIQEYLTIGYQRQLTYRHKDGSFSAFGPTSNNEGGGTWLTAFVLRCFADSFLSKHIQIDPKDIELSLKMLAKTQDENGGFKQVGSPLYSKALAGGLKDRKLGLSAYVLISMLKSANALKQELDPEIKVALARGIEYMSSAIEDEVSMDTYTLALASYAFKLANVNEDLTKTINDELDKRAVRQGDFVYWKEKENDDETKGFNTQSADLEITSYILISRLDNSEDIANLIPIAKWINSNRNSLGGFYSTQDTVVALEALSKFASVSYSKNINIRLDYTVNSQKQNYFVNNVNRLISVTRKLDNFKENEANSFKFELSGIGTVLVELIFKYNLVDENAMRVKNGFDFSITPVSTGRSECSNVKLSIQAKNKGDEESNSMVIVGLRLPTGWEATEDSVKLLENTHDLRKFELNENKLSLYFDELTVKGKNFEIDAIKKFEIKDVKPGQIYVYDYYEPLENALTQQFEISIC